MIPELLEFLEKVPDPLLAAVGALIGAIVLEIVRTFISRSKEAREDKKSEADTLREEIWKLRENAVRLENERDEWRDKYYEVMEKIITIQATLAAAELELKTREHDLHEGTMPKPGSDGGTMPTPLPPE